MLEVRRDAETQSRRNRAILLAFVGVVLMGGSNIVAVRFSNRELDPFWGAGLRFAVASILLWLVVARMGSRSHAALRSGARPRSAS